MAEPAIAVLPYGRGLGSTLSRTPVADLIWPEGCPDRLVGATASDLRVDDHLIVFPKTSTHFRIRRGTKAKISLIMPEPSIIHAKHLRLLRLTHRRFFKVLTYNEILLAQIPNGIFFPLGTTWVPEWQDLPLNKTRMTSLIASEKRATSGQQLRHATADWVGETGQDVDVLGQGFEPFERKSGGLAPYRYSIVIENVREQNYFSEKLVDAVLCNTVPIYWGCPNLERFCDPSGIIQCTSAEDIRREVETASEQDFLSRLPKIQAIQSELSKYCNLEKRAMQAIRGYL